MKLKIDLKFFYLIHGRKIGWYSGTLQDAISK